MGRLPNNKKRTANKAVLFEKEDPRLRKEDIPNYASSMLAWY